MTSKQDSMHAAVIHALGSEPVVEEFLNPPAAKDVTKESVMPTFVSVSQLQPKDGQRGKLIELLRVFAVSMHAEPGCVHYSVHEPIDDETGPLTVIQAYSSIGAFKEHSAWMVSNVPRLAALLASPPQPPVLRRQVSLSGHAKESLSA